VRYQHTEYEATEAEELAGADTEVATAPEPKPQPFVRQGGKIGRNDPCPCGSGKKYKQCHGRLET